MNGLFSKAAIVIVIVLCAVTMLVAAERSVARQSQPQIVPRSTTSETAPPLNRRTVGDRQYSGTHTWAAMLEIDADFIEYRDGTITASPHAIPQGITVAGTRRGITLTNLTFRGMGDGINIGNDQAVNELVIDNCRFLECRTPDISASDTLLHGRGYGMFASRGRNWTIRNSVFETKPSVVASPTESECLSQYAARLGDVFGLNVQNTRFENCGKPLVWLMFVRAASFSDCQFKGGPFRIGARSHDIPGVDAGNCRNIVFRNCTFEFGSYQDWPAGILIYPGAEHVTFENCTITTIPGSTWWLEVDPRLTSNIRWKDCTWNGEKVQGYRGVRSKMSIDEMKQRGIAPVENADEAAGERR